MELNAVPDFYYQNFNVRFMSYYYGFNVALDIINAMLERYEIIDNILYQIVANTHVKKWKNID